MQFSSSSSYGTQTLILLPSTHGLQRYEKSSSESWFLLMSLLFLIVEKLGSENDGHGVLAFLQNRMEDFVRRRLLERPRDHIRYMSFSAVDSNPTPLEGWQTGYLHSFLCDVSVRIETAKLAITRVDTSENHPHIRSSQICF